MKYSAVMLNEDKFSRPRTKFWPRGQLGLEDLTSLVFYIGLRERTMLVGNNLEAVYPHPTLHPFFAGVVFVVCDRVTVALNCAKFK